MTRPVLAMLALVACSPKAIEPAPAAIAAGEAPSEPAGVEAAPSDPVLFAHMVEHYASATMARDAVIGGRAEDARRHLAELGGHEPAASLAGALKAQVDAFQAPAKALGDDASLAQLAEAVGQSAAACGSCHAGMGVSLALDLTTPASIQSVPHHMQRHLWAVDKLWEGLVDPSETAWADGASALIHDEALGSTDVPNPADRDGAVDVMSRFIHEAGERAEEAVAPSTRASVFSDLIGACADCHAETGAKP